MEPPDLRAREGTRFKSSSSTAQYVIDKQGSLYYKRYLFANALTFYGMNGTLRTWSSGEVNGYSNSYHIHPQKTGWRARWGRAPSASAPLLFDRSYQCSGCQTAWATGIANAFNQWNARNTTIRFTEQPYNLNSEIHVIVRDVSSSEFGGWVELFNSGTRCPDENLPEPNCPGDSFNQANVFLNNVRVQATTNARNAITTHELGHSVSLAHDGLFGSPARCVDAQAPQTIMDYDCMYPFGTLLSPVASRQVV